VREVATGGLSKMVLSVCEGVRDKLVTEKKPTEGCAIRNV
jgi:hypothetical protein